jgi:hypothetical protein
MSKFIITIPADREHLANVESLSVCLRAYDVSKVEPLVFDEDDIRILNATIETQKRTIGELTQRLEFTTLERDRNSGLLSIAKSRIDELEQEVEFLKNTVHDLTTDRTMHVQCDRSITELGEQRDALTESLSQAHTDLRATEDREHELRIALDARIADAATKDADIDGWVKRCDEADAKRSKLVKMVRKHLVDLIDNGSIDEDAAFIVNMVEDYGMEPFARDLTVRIEFGPQFYCDIDFEAVPNRIDGDKLAAAVGKAIKYLSNADDVADMISREHADIEVEVDGHCMTGEFGDATWFPKWEKAYIVT